VRAEKPNVPLLIRINRIKSGQGADSKPMQKSLEVAGLREVIPDFYGVEGIWSPRGNGVPGSFSADCWSKAGGIYFAFQREGKPLDT
jgi:hypothetical protein